VRAKDGGGLPLALRGRPEEPPDSSGPYGRRHRIWR
jgi:hypothetical protein